MYFQYSNFVGEHEICRNVLVDDALLNGPDSFLFKELISDFSLRQVDQLSPQYPTTVLAASNAFIIQSSDLLMTHTEKRVFVFGERALTSSSEQAYIEHIACEDIPLSLSEWREKIITAEKTLVVKNSKFVDRVARIVSDSILPVRVKKRILKKIPMSVEKYEKEIERDVVFLPFSGVRFIGCDRISNKLVKKSILCGIRVQGVPVTRKEQIIATEKEVKNFKERILQYT